MGEPDVPPTYIEPEVPQVLEEAPEWEDTALSTASVTSSIYNFKQEHGRTYHSDHFKSNYAFPNDQREQDRLTIHYHSLRLALGDKLYFAPIANPRSIVDIGTGTGEWAIDMADAFPNASVLGTDISPIQPGFIPPNCSFQIMDLEEDWDMANNFDLVHTREMNGFCVRSWSKFYKQAFEALQPGGWVECQEFDFNISSDDGTIPENSAVKEWEALWESGGEQVGITARCYPEKMKEAMTEAGFVNVAILPFKMPIGPWAKDSMYKQSGLYTLVGLLDGVSGISLRVFTGVLGWTEERMEELLDRVRVEWKNRSIHSYFPIYVVYGQKPAG